jgi:hypothetical protein
MAEMESVTEMEQRSLGRFRAVEDWDAKIVALPYESILIQ